MFTSAWKVFRLRSIRKCHPHRLKLLLGLFVAVSVTYQVVPKLLFKTPWTYVGWHDTDFRLDVDESEIIILRWTSYWGEYYNPDVLTAKTCPYLQPSTKAGSGEVFDIPCRITFDRRYLRASDALVFHSYDLTREEVPQKRSKDQIWVYMEQECPAYTKANLHEFPGVFNWTMTYRRDSDAYYPYGHIVPILETDTASDLHYSTNSTSSVVNRKLTKRPNLVAWIVSSCDSHSKREYFVKELQLYIPIGIYGWCGRDCPSYSDDCYPHVAKTHKFYLSFENSFCSDYITEKFFDALKSNMVPVVYGGEDPKDYSAIAPERSYIDARTFKTAKELAKYLLYLDQNDEEYLKYFEWKNKYKVIDSQGWCNLCQRVFEHLQFAPESSSVVPPERKRTYKWYQDLWAWWNYLSYDPTLEQDEMSGPSRLSVIGPSYYYKMGAPACKSPMTNLTGSLEKKLDFKPGLFNRKAITKWARWVKHEIFG